MSKLFEQLRKAADARAKAGPPAPTPAPAAAAEDLRGHSDVLVAKEPFSTDDTARQFADWQAQADGALALAKKHVADEALTAARAATERARAEDEARQALERRLEAQREAEAALVQRIEAERLADDATKARLEVERLAAEQARRIAELERQVRHEQPNPRSFSRRVPLAVAVMVAALLAIAWAYAPWRPPVAEPPAANPSPALKLDPSLKTK